MHDGAHELRERESWLRGPREALEAALNGAPLETSLGVLVRTAIDALGEGTRAAFYLANGDGTSLHHVVGMSAAYAEAVDGFKIGPESLACGLATHTGQPIVTRDVTQDPLWEPWVWLAERFDYRGCWSFPILTAGGKFIGSLAVYARQPREATRRNLELASLVTDTASIIISRHQEWEARKRAETALRDSEARMRALVEASADVVYQMGPDWTEMRILHGRTVLADTASPTRSWLQTYILPEDQPMVMAVIQRAIDERRVFELEHRVRHADGGVGWVFSRAVPILDERGEIAEWCGAASDVTERHQREQRLTAGRT